MNVAKLLANAKKNKDALKSRESTIKPKPGKNNYVLLGDWNQERNEEFYKPFSQHFIKDYSKVTDGKPETTVHVCMSKTFDEDCPICDAIAEAGRLIGANATDEQIKTLEDAKASTVYLLNVLEVDDSGKHDGQPKALQVGKLTLSSILDMMDDWGEAIFVDHQVVTINREGTGLNTKYNVLPGSKKVHVDPEVFKHMIDLDDYVKQANEERKRLALGAIRRAAGLYAPAEPTHVPAERTIGTSSALASDVTDVSYKDVTTSSLDVTEIDLGDELEALLDDAHQEAS
ncbi:hypothetical protein Q4029_16990 [Acinetobacter baumannii]|uniref:Bacteriophage T4 Gp32 single-stranded DNA-binding domain-containing protein n=1 Tax=Acinetobacter baumannii TaxID=470 RepID=A0A1S2FYA7_ACIBA|nr:hypothetical protein [Acinetobacter baumannii]AHB93276.1 hypothetical protein P795_18190 [Acinetobacter baumannii ZW85-1]EKV2268322.1 hypothetical protein [Acinetobacter baumannii]KCY33565.1 hypothetical protein J726_3853 [Acinetobacter baumannii 1262761-105]MBC6798206.1 hypothetical protein [Acinetobacter baumannii]MBO2812381.1 hypothetical protein [Acinetobacter baumannii]